jgi:hypothetical protein
VHRLKAKPADARNDRDERRAKERRGEEGPREKPPHAGRGIPLERQPRSQAHHAHIGLLVLEAIEPPLDLRLVAGVEAGPDTAGRPRLVHGPVLRTGRVGADRGCVDERRNPGGGNGVEHAPAAGYVDAPERPAVVGGLDRPGEVHDRVGAAEERNEIARHDVGLRPLGLGERHAGPAPRDAEHGGDGRIPAQRLEHARAVIPARADDHDSHARDIPARRAG